ncbi:TonB-dependent receptor plug domain-containing protein [Segetibacter koreensis]|uniref:TonB-dependent receptor plug domain-containing protein n=1 Tax=Segetibacter koreensis TaxID=398037 RepID=UPI000365AB50|nr:TonB-dependent receptor [Segetibacter koreensis]
MAKKLLTTVFIFAALTATAQTDTLQGSQLDEVVVTANKYPQKQSTTGKVITVITKDEIEKSNGKTLPQLLNEQAGVTINGALNNLGAVQTAYVRGAASGRTLILLDGVPVNDPSMINNEFDLNLISLDNIDRVEICKGAQSTLYGSDAVAGVINIISVREDVNKPFNVKATLGGGSFRTFKGSFQLYGKKDRLTYSVRHSRLTSSGFSSAYDSTGSSNFDKDGYDGNATNAQVTFKASENLSLKSFLLYSAYKADIDAGVFSDEKDYTIDNRSLTTGVGFSYKKSVIALNGTYQYSNQKRNYFNDSLYRTSIIFEDNRYNGKTDFTELYASIKLNNAATLLAGADYRFSSYNQFYSSVSTYGPYTAPPFDSSLHQKAVYASLNVSALKNKLNIELGGRVNKHSRYGTNGTYTFNPSYTITKNVRMFGSIASGFKAPTLYQLSINEALQPEKSVNYEAGIQFSNKIFTSRVIYFYRKIDNGIDYNYITFQYFNYVKQIVNGIEMEATVKPVKQLTITSNYTWIASQETTQNRATNKDTVTYAYSLRRPKHSLNLNVGWQPTGHVYFSVTGKYVSSRFDVGGYQMPDVLLKDYFIVGAHGELTANSHVRFFADAQNLFNQKFFDIRGYNSIPALFNGGVVLNW